MWGIIGNLDEVSLKLPLSKELSEECNLFWNRVYYVFSKTSTVDTHDFTKTQKFIKEQLPVDAKEVIDCSYRCSLFISKNLHMAVRIVEIDEDGFKYFYPDIVSETEAEELLLDIKPVIKLIKEYPSTGQILEPLLYQLIYNSDSVKEIDIIDILNRIPTNLHEVLIPLKDRRTK